MLLPLIEEDLLPWFLSSATGNILELQLNLGRLSPKKSHLVGVHVVMAAHGYPGTEGVRVRSGDKILIDKIFNPTDKDYLFFAGVDQVDKQLVTKGGRILGVTSLSENFRNARGNVYELISHIHFDGAQFRQDIGNGQV